VSDLVRINHLLLKQLDRAVMLLLKSDSLSSLSLSKCPRASCFFLPQGICISPHRWCCAHFSGIWCKPLWY